MREKTSTNTRSVTWILHYILLGSSVVIVETIWGLKLRFHTDVAQNINVYNENIQMLLQCIKCELNSISYQCSLSVIVFPTLMIRKQCPIINTTNYTNYVHVNISYRVRLFCIKYEFSNVAVIILVFLNFFQYFLLMVNWKTLKINLLFWSLFSRHALSS